jgi:hypothetical protein
MDRILKARVPRQVFHRIFLPRHPTFNGTTSLSPTTGPYERTGDSGGSTDAILSETETLIVTKAERDLSLPREEEAAEPLVGGSTPSIQSGNSLLSPAVELREAINGGSPSAAAISLKRSAEEMDSESERSGGENETPLQKKLTEAVLHLDLGLDVHLFAVVSGISVDVNDSHFQLLRDHGHLTSSGS